VQSSNPHPISKNLRKFQEILDPNNTMDLEVFNLGVRLIAYEESSVLWEPKYHLLNLKFVFACNYRRHPKYRVNHKPKEWLHFSVSGKQWN